MGWWPIMVQMFPPAPKWSVKDIPDLQGKVILVTGGNTGLGYEIVKPLLLHGAKVYIAARNEEKTKSAVEDLKGQTGNEAIFLPLDLADLASVRQCAEEFLRKESKLHILFNNAGIMEWPVEAVTKQNLDLQFGVNVVGHFHLTELLIPAILAASTPTDKARIVTMSSSAIYLVQKIKWDSLVDGPVRRSMNTPDLYNQSKFANTVVAREIARRYGHQGVVSTSISPGNLSTDLQRHITGIRKWIINRIVYPPPMGALTPLWAGTAAETADYNGKFLISWARLGKPQPETDDPKVGKELWEWLEKFCKDY